MSPRRCQRSQESVSVALGARHPSGHLAGFRARCLAPMVAGVVGGLLSFGGTAAAEGKIEQQVNLVNCPGSTTVAIACTTTSTTDTPTTGALGRLKWDPSQYSGQIQVYFEAVMSISAGGTATATLYDQTSAAAVTGSAITTTSAPMARVRSGDIAANMTAGDDMTVRIKRTTAGTTTLLAARLIVVQTLPSGTLASTETSIDVGNNTTMSPATANVYVDLADFKIFRYDASKYDGSLRFFLEATLWSNNGTRLAKARLVDKTATDAGTAADKAIVPTVLSGGCGTAGSDALCVGSTTVTRVRGELPAGLADGHEYKLQLTNSNTSGITKISNARIVIDQKPAIDQRSSVGSTDANMGDASANTARAQSFKVSTSGYYTGFAVQVGKAGAPTDFLRLSLRDGGADGTILNSDDTILADFYVAPGNLTTTTTPYDYFFSRPIWLTSQTSYYLKIERTGAVDATNYYKIAGGTGTADTYPNDGAAQLYNGSSWAAQTWDHYFSIYSTPPTKLETYQQQINAGATDADSTYTAQNYLNLFDPANFVNVKNAYFFEATLKTSAGSYFADVRNVTDSVDITSSEVTASDTAYTRKRTADITANMPSAAKTLDTQLKNNATNTTSCSASWLIVDINVGPGVSAIAPAQGPLASGTPVTIYGSGFRGGATATIGGSAATQVFVVSSTRITALAPSGSAGTADVVVTNTDATTATLGAGYTYVAEQFSVVKTVTSDFTSGTLTNLSTSGIAIDMSDFLWLDSTPATTGGSIATGTYYYVVTATDLAGNETLKGPQSRSTGIAVTGPNGSVSLKWRPIPGATGYKLYRSTTSGTYSTPALITTISATTASTANSTISYTDTAAATSSGAPPGSNTTNGELTFSYGTVPSSGAGTFTVGGGPALVGTAANLATLGAHSLQRPDGTFLVILGNSTANTSLYDPVANTFTAGPALVGTAANLANAGAHSLQRPDGTFLVVLGNNTANTSLYDPVANTFTAGPALIGTAANLAYRGAHSLQRPDGKFLMILGGGTSNTAIYDAGWKTGTTGQNGTQGSYVSEALNPTANAAWKKVSWQQTSDADINTVEVRTATTSGGLLSATYRTLTNGGDVSPGSGETWLQAKITFIRKAPNFSNAHSGNFANVRHGEEAVHSNRAFPIPDIQSLTVTYAKLQVSAIVPSAGRTSGGTPFTLTGTGFESGATVTIGGASATSVFVVSSTMITGISPSGTAGAQNVVVTNPVGGATATMTGGFTYNAVAGYDQVSKTVAADFTAAGSSLTNLSTSGILNDLTNFVWLDSTPATTGGSIATGTYYYVVTATDLAGNETLKGPESRSTGIAVTGPTGSVSLKWRPIANATGYKLYRSTTSGTYTSPALVTTISATSASTVNGTISYTDTTVTASLSAGAPPGSNTTNGELTFSYGTVPASGQGSFTATSGLVSIVGTTANLAFVGAHSLQRPDGTFLVILGNATSDTSLYDPVANTFTAGPALIGTAANLANAGAHSLQRPDGKFLVILGINTSNTSLYDPVANTFTAGPALIGTAANLASGGAHSLQRPDGKFLVILGNTTSNTAIYDAGWQAGTTAQNGVVGTYVSEDLNPSGISSWDKISWVKTRDNTIQAADNTVDQVEVCTAATQAGLGASPACTPGYAKVANGAAIPTPTNLWMRMKVTFRRDRPDWSRVDHPGAKVWLGENDTKESRAFPIPDIQSLTATYNKTAVPFTVSGTVYLANETTTATSANGGPCDGSTIVSIRVNGVAAGTGACSAANATYSIAGISANAGDTVTVYLTSTQKANTVYLSDGDATTDSGINLFVNRVAVGHQNAGPVAIADLWDYDSTADDPNMLFDAVDATPDTLTVESGVELHVLDGKTFTPAGTVTTTSADFHVDDNAVSTLDTATSAIGLDIKVDTGATLNINATTTVGGGDITTSGTGVVNTTSGTPIVTVSGTGNLGGGGTVTVYNLTVSGTQTVASALTVKNDLTVNGTLNGSQNVTANGVVAGTGTITMSGGTVEQQVTAGKAFGTTSGTTAWSFSNLTFSNANTGATPITITTSTGGSGGITVSGTLLVGKSGDVAGATTTLDAGNRTWTLSGTGGDPFQLLASPAGALTAATSTVAYTGNNAAGNTTVQAATYTGLTLNNSAETYVLEGATTASGDLTITAGTLDVTATNYGLTIGGNYTNNGVFTAQAGTVTFNGSGKRTLSGTLNGTSAFYKTLFNRSALSWGGALVGGDGVNSSWNGGTYKLAYSFASLNNKLYAGIGNSTAAGDGEVWEYNGSSWTQVGGTASGNWGTAAHELVRSLTVHNNKLYAGLGDTAGADAEVWEYSGSGTAWTKVGGDGVNASWTAGTYQFVRALASFNGKLYAGIGSTAAGDGEAWEYNGTAWTRIAGGGTTGNWASGTYEVVRSLAVHSGKLYAGLGDSAGDGEVWEYSGSGSAWTQIGGDGISSSWTTAGNYEQAFSLASSNGKLYAGLGLSAGDAEVWEYSGGAWTQVGGTASGNWGTATYEYIRCLRAFNSKLYAGLGELTGAAEVWEYSGSGTTWTKVGGDAVSSSWADATYEAVYDLASLNGKLYAGLGNTAGTDAEVWELSFGDWTITSPMIVSASTTDAMVIRNGVVTVGDSDLDSLEVRGTLLVANTAGEVGTLQSAALAQGSTVTVHVNQPTPVSCTNCKITVGATSGTGQGNLVIQKNAVLRLNAFNGATAGDSDVGVEVESTGYLDIEGSQDATGTSDGTTTETTLTDTTKSWTTNTHANNVVRMTSGLAIGMIYTINSNTATALTRTDNSSVDSTFGSSSGTGPTRKICLGSADANRAALIAANDEGIGRYLHDATGPSTGYLKIVDSVNDDATCTGTTDSFTVIAEPDAFTILAASDVLDISDAVRTNDTYEILDYAQVTAENGTACGATVNQNGEAYILGKQGSETLIRYAELCNLGRNASTKYGLSFGTGTGVNGANAGEGVTIDKARVRKNFIGINFTASTQSNNAANSKGITNSIISDSSDRGIQFDSDNDDNAVSSNRIFNNGLALVNGGEGLYIYGGSDRNTVSGNYSYGNTAASGRGLRTDNQVNTFSGNYVYGNGTFGIHTAGNGSVISSNVIFGNVDAGILAGSLANAITSNVIYANGSTGINLQLGASSVLLSNQIYANAAGAGGINLREGFTGKIGAVLIGNQVYSSGKGLRLTNDTTDTNLTVLVINDIYGGGGNLNTTADINDEEVDDVAPGTAYRQARLYNTTLNSTTSAAGLLATHYVISRKHNGTAGATKIWKDYSVPAADSTTQQAEETEKYNYADNLWEHSNSPPGFAGTGTGTLTVNALPVGLATAEWYRAVVTTAAANGGTFTVTRSGGTASPATLALPGTAGGCATYTETTTLVSFQICDGATDFTKDDVFLFAVWPKSSDPSTAKTVTLQQAGDSFTIPASTSAQFDGAAGFLSTLSTVTGAYDLTVNGTLSGGNNTLTVTGNVNGTGTVSLTSGSTLLQRVGAAGKTFGTTSGALDWTLQDLKFENASAGALTITTNAGGSGKLITSGTLTVGNAGDSATTTLDNETNDRILDANGDVTITSQGVLQASSTAAFTVAGSYANSGTFTAGTGTVTFDATAAGKTLSGRLNNAVTSSAFSKVLFNGAGGGWTIQDAMLVSAADTTNTLEIRNGTVTLGDSDLDNLEVDGKWLIGTAGGASQVAVFQTAALPQGQSLTIDLNKNTGIPECDNCLISVGAASTSTGSFKLSKNTILRLNPAVGGTAGPNSPDAGTDSDTGLEVESTGYLELLGNQDLAPTASTALDTMALRSTKLCAATTFTAGQHTNKMARMSSGLGIGLLYSISATTVDDADCASTQPGGDDSITIGTGEGESSVDTAGGLTITGTGPTRTVAGLVAGTISANDQGIGRYLRDATGTTGYYKIVDSTDGGAGTDSVVIIAEPDPFANLATTDTVDLSDGLRPGDTVEILDYAQVTAEAGTACTATVNQNGEAYVLAKAGSETIIRYAELCNLGREVADRYGLVFNGVNGANPSEGLTVDKARIRKANNGISLIGSSNNSTANGKGITSNTTSGNGGTGIYLSTSSANTLTGNTASGNTSYGIFLYDNSKTNTLTSNTATGNTDNGIFLSTSSANILTSNSATGNPAGIYLSTSSANILTSNSATGNPVGIYLGTSSANILTSNSATGNTIFNGILLYGNSNANTLINNIATGNADSGIQLTSSSLNTLFANSAYSNGTVGLGLYSSASTGNRSINDNFGGSGANPLADVSFTGTGAHNLQLYGTTLASSTEVSGVTVTGAYVISRKHDGTAGVTKIWGQYSVPAAVAETPQAEETDQFNYANNLWGKSATAHGYSGTGTEDANLDYDLSTATLTSGPYAYRAVATTAGTCAAAVFTVYRYNSAGTETNVGTASCGSLFTDTNASVNVKFKIDGASPTAYALGDTYTFVVWDASGDAGTTAKTVTLMQDGDLLTVPVNTTLQLQGAAGNLTTVTRGGASTDGYSIDVSGVIDASYYTLSYLKGPTNGYGLELLSGATITNLANGTFNNYQSVTASDAYLWVHDGLIGTGNPTKSFANVTFTQNGAGAPEYSVSQTVTGPTGFWNFPSATCTGWASCEAADNDTGTGDGTIRWLTGFTITGLVYLGNETTLGTAANSGPCNDTAVVSVRVNGGSATTTTCSSTDATFSAPGILATAGDTLTLYLTAAQKANTVYVSDGTADASVPLMVDRLIVGHMTAGPVAIANLWAYDSTTDNPNMLFDAVDLATDTLTTESGVELHVLSGSTFTPSGTVTTNATGGDVHLDDNAALTFGAATNSLGRDLLIDPGATATVTATTTLTRDLTVTGTVNGTGTLTVKGALTGAGAVTMTGGTVEQQVTAGQAFGTTSGSNAWSFTNLTFSNANATATPVTLTTQTGGSGGITVSGTLLVGKSGDAAGATTTLNAGNRTWTLSGTGGDPFQLLASPAGALTAATSTFSYTGNNAAANTTVQAATYTGLTLNNSAETYVLEGATTASGDLTITAGTLDVTATNYGLTIGGAYANTGTFTARSGTVTFTATTTGKTLSGRLNNAVTSSAFYKAVFNGVGGGWTIQDPMLVTFASGDATAALDLQNGTVTLGNGDLDNLEVDGKWLIANTANQTATFQTAALAQGSSLTIDLNNNATLPTCANCVITVGATSGTGQGSFKLAKNTVLRLNPRSAVTASDTGLEVESTGYLEILGSQDATGTSDGATTETTLTDSTKSWTTNTHANKIVRMTAGLAIGMLYTIDSNTATTLTRANNSSVDSILGASTGSGPTRKICLGSADANRAALITADNEGIGRYLHDATGTPGYLKIIDSVNNDTGCTGTTDSFTVIAEPDAFTILAASDVLDISDAVRVTDTYEILDYAAVTAEAGTACTATVNQNGEAYILAKAGSESLIRYAELCNMGRYVDASDNTHGLTFNGVNGANPGEGLTVDKARIRKSTFGIWLRSASNNSGAKGVMNSSVATENLDGIGLDNGSNANAFTGNRVFNSTAAGTPDGFYLNSGQRNTVTSNLSYGHNGRGFMISDLSNTVTSNQAWGNSQRGFDVPNSGTVNTVLRANVAFGNGGGGFSLYSSSSNTTLVANQSYGNAEGITLEGGATNNVLAGNTIYSNAVAGFRIAGSSTKNLLLANQVYQNGVSGSGNGVYLNHSDTVTQTFVANQIYNNQSEGLFAQTTSGTISVLSINDAIGVSGGNGGVDVDLSAGTVGKLQLYNTTLSSASGEVGTGVTAAGAYVASFKHDGAAGATKIWGEYSVPAAVTETPQSEEVAKFNYGNHLWEKSATAHGYAGTGTEDANLDYDLATATLTSGPYAYRAVATTAGTCAAAVFTVYRYNSAGTETNVGTASCGTLFTDTNASVNVKFKIDGGGTAYVAGDTYTFVVWDASGDAGTAAKTVTVMQEGDKLTVPVNTTLELKGASGNLTTVTRGGATTDGYSLDVSGTIDATYYTLSYLKGPTNGYGLELLSGATITNLANGTFNNYQSVTASDAYLWIHDSLIGALSPTKSFANVTFTQNGAGAPEYSVSQTVAGPTGYWLFSTATCTGWADCESSDNDTGSGNGTIQFGGVTIRIPRHSGSGQYPAIY